MFAPRHQSRRAECEKSQRARLRDLTGKDSLPNVRVGEIIESKAVERRTIHGDTGPAVLDAAAVIEAEADKAHAGRKPLVTSIAASESQSSVAWNETASARDEWVSGGVLASAESRNISISASDSVECCTDGTPETDQGDPLKTRSRGKVNRDETGAGRQSESSRDAAPRRRTKQLVYRTRIMNVGFGRADAGKRGRSARSGVCRPT